MTPVDRDPAAPSGADPGQRYMNAWMTRDRARRDGSSIRAAARAIAKETGKDARTLENAVAAGRKTPQAAAMNRSNSLAAQDRSRDDGRRTIA